jgi:hypothetical protein
MGTIFLDNFPFLAKFFQNKRFAAVQNNSIPFGR